MVIALIVSILVLMDVGLKLGICIGVKHSTFVSILVLMDVGLKLQSTVNPDDMGESFNPCFNGCRSEASYYGFCRHYG